MPILCGGGKCRFSHARQQVTKSTEIFLSNSDEISEVETDNEISISGAITGSYQFFMSHFNHFVRLAWLPMAIWVLVELGCDYALNEYGLVYDSMVPRAIVSAAFALVWYRQFLMGEKYATYDQMFENVVSPGVFNLYSLLFLPFHSVSK